MSNQVSRRGSKFTEAQIDGLIREPIKTSQGHTLRCDMPYVVIDAVEPYIAYPIELKDGGFSETSVNAFWWLANLERERRLKDFEDSLCNKERESVSCYLIKEKQ